MNTEQARALLMVGQLVGLACRINTTALEEYLKGPAPDFEYEELCRLTIEFSKAVNKLGVKDAYTIG